MRLNLRTKSKRTVLFDRHHFLKRLAVLMQEGYLLPTALTLLLPMHTKKLQPSLDGVTSILKSGGNAAEILHFLGFKEQVLFPIEIAEYHGRLAESIGSIAKSFERTENVQKKLRNLLVYPVSLLVFTSILFLFFRTNYVPNLVELTESLRSSSEGAAMPDYLLKLPDLFIGMFLVTGTIAFVFSWILKKQPIEKQVSLLLSIPLVRLYVKMYWSQLLARELGTLLHSGISIQESLGMLKNQTYHRAIGYIAHASEQEIIMGQPLSVALSRFPFVVSDMPSFVQHGEATGHLGKELILFSEVLMERIELKTQQLMRIIQPAFFLMIAACIIGAYLAILLPMYSLVQTI
ncbi:competence type IV pilus assembly protein ComGB [Planococcus sp. YIM B11945]|uniref:competence type IV pilus assembly protein ComGB n=1 Tax=Planococcus sp. YIM B11945 TaxID=3435410 RepID=UPI003D7D9E45